MQVIEFMFFNSVCLLKGAVIQIEKLFVIPTFHLLKFCINLSVKCTIFFKSSRLFNSLYGLFFL